MAKSYRGNKSRKNSSKKNVSDKARYGNERDSRRESETTQSALNDISWYSRNPQLLAAAGSFPYPYRPGMDLNLAEFADGWNSVTRGSNATIPGVWTIDWIPSFGISQTSTDPASIAGKEFYGRVRAAYSGQLDADAPDYITYIGALDSVFSYIGWLKRVYRAISSYSQDNYLLPDAILLSCGFSTSNLASLRQQKTWLWQMINELILKTRKFRCPAVMDMFNRHYWMSDNIYADAPSTRAQLYMFNLVGVYTVAQVPEGSKPSNTVAGLKMLPVPRAPKDSSVTLAETLVDFGESLIQTLDAWDSAYTISGYLERAFAGAPEFTIAELLQGELLSMSYVPEVLSQIENTRTVLPSQFSSLDYTAAMFGGMTVSQNVLENAVLAKNQLIIPDFSTQDVFTAGVSSISPFLNIHSDNPQIADSVIASRLHTIPVSIVKSGSGATAVQTVTADSATELPLMFRMVCFRSNPSANHRGMALSIIPQFVGYERGTNAPIAERIAVLAMSGAFDWHPFIYLYAKEPSSLTTQFFVPVGDMYNVTKLDADQVKNLHKVCIYSELNSFGV